ncbi:MAG: phage tail protein, partial [Oscillospiraceae bacterium]|nr:phage tail protein [Oscillospiraceae bacterium]
MALGAGTFTVQNKALPGAYINFVSAARADASLSERGVAAVPLVLPWGPEGTVFTVTADEFYGGAERLFGCGAYSAELLPLRELFRGARAAVVGRVNRGGTAAGSAP